jgi:hypothetical protein
LKKYGKWIEFPRIGKRERPKNPALIPNENLRYAQVVKSKHGKRLQDLKKEFFETLLFLF